MAALPQLPGLSQVGTAIAAQAKALAQLPHTLVDLNRSIGGLADALVSARETIASVAHVTARLERVTEQLEEPVLALRPGMQRVARVLDDDAIDRLPQTLRTINEDVLPLLQGLRDTQSRVNALANVVPGASLLFARRPRQPEETSGNGDATIEWVAEAVTEPGED